MRGRSVHPERTPAVHVAEDDEVTAPVDARADQPANSTGAARPLNGLIIFLNGASSSGKSSIARELLPILGGPYFYLPVDAIDTMLTWTDYQPDALPAVLRRALMGFHRAVAGMAAAGNNVVVDDVLSEPWRLLDCLALFSPKDVVLVGVSCQLEELERRERARSDRSTGLAASQLERVHAHGVYDLEVDTSTTSPLDCARQIKDFLPQRPSPTAFEQLKVRLSA